MRNQPKRPCITAKPNRRGPTERQIAHFVPLARETPALGFTNYPKWMPTTLPPGAKAEQRQSTTAKCSAKRTTAPKATSSTLIPLFRKQRHKLGLTPRKSALIYVAYKSFIGQNNQPSLVVLLFSAENAFVVFVLRNAQRTFIFGKLQQFMV